MTLSVNVRISPNFQVKFDYNNTNYNKKSSHIPPRFQRITHLYNFTEYKAINNWYHYITESSLDKVILHCARLSPLPPQNPCKKHSILSISWTFRAVKVSCSSTYCHGAVKVSKVLNSILWCLKFGLFLWETIYGNQFKLMIT